MFLGQRRLEHSADAAANDAAAAAVDRSLFEAGVNVDPNSPLGIDTDRARRLVAQYVLAAEGDGLDITSVVTRVESNALGQPARLVVEVEGTMIVVFGDALPGASDRRAIRARSVVDLTEATGA